MITDLCTIYAVDSKGNRFRKKVKLLTGEHNPYRKYCSAIIHFDSICEYGFESLQERREPGKGLCIDIEGRNHDGVPDVVVSAKNMAKIMKLAESILQPKGVE